MGNTMFTETKGKIMEAMMKYAGPVLGCAALYAIAYGVGKAMFYITH